VLGFFVCGVVCRCGLQAHSTVGACVCLGFRVRGHDPLRAASPQHGWRMCVLGFSFAGDHVPLRAASPQHSWRMCVLGFSFAGSCAAAGCKPTARLAYVCAWFFVCGVMCRCGLQAHSTVGVCVCLGFSFARSCSAAGCKPTARSAYVCAWVFVCEVMFRCGLQAHSTVGVCVCLGFRLRDHVPLRAASPQHGWRMCVLGFSFAGSCAAAGRKPAARLAYVCAWFFVCGVMCRCGLQAHSTVAPACAWFFVCGVMFRCGLQAHSTVGVCVCLGFRLRGHVPLRAASPQHGWRMCVLGFSFAGSCSAAGCKPTARSAYVCAWVFVCGIMCRCGLQARSTSGKRRLVLQRCVGAPAIALRYSVGVEVTKTRFGGIVWLSAPWRRPAWAFPRYAGVCR
jgi:hypothetical protein